MDKADIFAIPAQDYKIHAEPNSLYEDFIDSLYARAQAYFSGKLGKPITDPRDIPEKDLLEFFRRFEIVSHIFMFKGLASLQSGDPALAGRLFDEAIKVLPAGAKLPELFFYSLALKLAYNWPEEHIRQAAEQLYGQDPNANQNPDSFLKKLGPIGESIKAPLQKALAKYKSQKT